MGINSQNLILAYHLSFRYILLTIEIFAQNRGYSPKPGLRIHTQLLFVVITLQISLEREHVFTELGGFRKLLKRKKCSLGMLPVGDIIYQSSATLRMSIRFRACRCLSYQSCSDSTYRENGLPVENLHPAVVCVETLKANKT